MYLPPKFQPNNIEACYDLINNYPLAMLMVIPEMEISHIPLLLEHENTKSYLRGHIARANPLHQLMLNNPEILCVFNGPHAYISPTYYQSTIFSVPTWNYVVVHVKGTVKLVDEIKLIKILDASIEKYESQLDNPWSIDWNDELAHKKLNGIIGFEIEISHIQGKFKLSQNRTLEEQISVKTKLGKSRKQDDQTLALFMLQD